MAERLQDLDPFKTSTRLHNLSFFLYHSSFTRRVWRNQRGNQNLYIKEQATQWPKEKVQKDKQRSTKQTHKNKDRLTRTPQKPGVNSGAPEGWAVPAPLVTPVTICVPFLDYTTIIWNLRLVYNAWTLNSITDKMILTSVQI